MIKAKSMKTHTFKGEFATPCQVRDFVVSYLHHAGANNGKLNARQDGNIRWFFADGYGDLAGMERDVAVELVFDWSHVRDSSEKAFDNMARAILKKLGRA
tara:strand:- start:194 stop:493 length:300 start_codon:yes stop_codon:yes gene_type:complete